MSNCYVCNRVDGLDSHHIHPIAYGGAEDGPQILLCSLCHRDIHTAALRVYSGKHNFIELFESPAHFERAKLLIKAIVNSRIQMESSGRGLETIRRLMLEIPNDLHIALHRKKQDGGFTNLQTYIIDVLRAHVNK